MIELTKHFGIKYALAAFVLDNFEWLLGWDNCVKLNKWMNKHAKND